MISALFIAVPGSNAVAAIISGAVLEMDGLLGLTGWQWMFIVEAVPAVLLAFAVLVLLTDRPAVATWLEPAEREWLESALRDERRQIERAGHLGLFQALSDARVLILSLIYLAIVTATYGITFFLPQIVKGIGLSNMMTGLVTAIPYTIGTIGMLLWGAFSDRYDERRWHFCVACMLATIGFIGAGVFGSSFLALAFMSVATIGLYGSKPAFWPMPSFFLTGTAAAGGVAMVNSIGNLGGYFGPFIVGWIKDSTGSFEAGLYFLAASALASRESSPTSLCRLRRRQCTNPTWRRPPSDLDRHAAANLVQSTSTSGRAAELKSSRRAMSASGTKRTSRSRCRMSAFGGIADMAMNDPNVCL